MLGAGWRAGQVPQHSIVADLWLTAMLNPPPADFTTPHAPGRPGDDDDNGKGDKSRAREQASGSQGYGGGGSGVDAEAGPSTSLLHSTSASSEEEFARMSAAGQAAVRRLRLRRRGSAGAGGASGASGSGWADGAGPSTAAASGADGEEARQERVPITLLCGHTFCTACEWGWGHAAWVGAVLRGLVQSLPPV